MRPKDWAVRASALQEMESLRDIPSLNMYWPHMLSFKPPGLHTHTAHCGISLSKHVWAFCFDLM
jgi:hypothetical protein